MGRGKAFPAYLLQRRVSMKFELKFAIVRSGRTQREVSLAAGIAETQFSEIVRGRYQPTTEEQTRIAEALRVSVQSIFPANLAGQAGGDK
jgi:transcriptional regulator with XRE-family HTH domain